MKPKNFPARKLKRQLDANIRDGKRHDKDWDIKDRDQLIEQARSIRTKKFRGSR